MKRLASWLAAFATMLALSGAARAQDAQATEPAAAPAPAERAEPAPMDPAPMDPAPSARPQELEAIQAQIQALQARIDQLEAQAALGSIEGGEDSALMEMTEPTLSIYGFFDFGFDRLFLKGRRDDDFGVLRPTRESSFVFGNLNLYFDAAIDPKWQTLFEVRFTLAPHGEEIGLDPPIGTSYERIDSTAFDFSSPSAQSQLRLGSIFIERAWTEWKPSDLLRVQAGLFLNPFGIWNVDHGSPTLIALSLPTFVAGQMMPGRLLGVQAHGAYSWDDQRLAYYLHVSNGRTPLDYDLTDDKALGARLTMSWDWQGSSLMLGGSTYHGTYEDQHKVIDPVAAVTPGRGFFDWETVVAYREHVWGLDASVDIGDLRLRSEGVARWVYYEEGKREKIFVESGGERYSPDRLEWDAYLIAAYRLWQLEPYVMVEGARKSFVLPRFAREARSTAADVVIAAPSVGLNVRLAPRVLLKGQAQLISTHTGPDLIHQWTAYVFYTRLVSSF